MLLLQQMLVLFIYMMLGFFLARKGVLDERAGKTFSWMVVNVANPALIILPTINKETTLSPEQIWEALKLAVIMYVALIVIAKVITIFMRTSMEKNLYQMMMIFNNIAFMGFPNRSSGIWTRCIIIFGIVHITVLFVDLYLWNCAYHSKR